MTHGFKGSEQDALSPPQAQHCRKQDLTWMNKCVGSDVYNMGDPECGFEEMQGVRLGYLLIKGKQMFALSQVFTDLLQNIPRTTVHKRMDHLKVHKHHCDLTQLRKLKATNTIAFHAAKCTLISREDVEALYSSCKTQRVFRSNKRRAKPVRDEDEEEEEEEVEDASQGFVWKEKVWLSLHDSKRPHLYHKTHGQDQRTAVKSTPKHFKNYETSAISGNRVTWSQRHAFFRSRQSVVLQSSTGDLLHKRRKRRRRKRRDSHYHPAAPAPVLLLQPKFSSFGPFHLSQDFYLNPRPHPPPAPPHHHHHHQPSLPESYSSDTESSTYSYPDSDFGSGFSTSSSSEEEEEEEDEDDTQSESSDVSSSDDEEEEEEESSSQSDSSSVSSRVSVQSIRFRRARVCLSTSTSTSSTSTGSRTPLVMQPCTFQYNQAQEQEKQENTRGQEFLCSEKDLGVQKFRSLSLMMGESFYLNESKREVEVEKTPAPPSPLHDQKKASWKSQHGDNNNHHHHNNNSNNNTKFTKCARLSSLTPSSSLKKIKTELEEPCVTSYPDSAGTPPFNLCNVKVKVEENCEEYGYQCQNQTQYHTTGQKTERISEQHLIGIKVPDVDPDPDVASTSFSGTITHQDYAPCVDQKDQGDTICKKPRLSSSRTQPNKQNTHCFSFSSSSSSSSSSPPCARAEKAPVEDLPSRRKRSTPFSLMANFPSLPSLIVGRDGDLCPAHSLNSLRGRGGPPPPSHPVWRWQPGGHILPPPQAQRIRKY